MPNFTPESHRLVTLLRRVAKQDHDAFTQLYELTSAHLYSVALRFVFRRELADEVLQDAFINVWQQAGSYAASLSTPMTWLISVVRNKCLDHLRKYKPQLDYTDSLDDRASDLTHEEAAENIGPHELFDFTMRKAELHRCMALLDPPQRQSIALAYYVGLSHSELADHLQVPLGTAKAWVRRGLCRLRNCFESPALPRS